MYVIEVLFSTVVRLGKILGKFIPWSAWLSLNSGERYNLYIHGLTLDLVCMITVCNLINFIKIT